MLQRESDAEFFRWADLVSRAIGELPTGAYRKRARAAHRALVTTYSATDQHGDGPRTRAALVVLVKRLGAAVAYPKAVRNGVRVPFVGTFHSPGEAQAEVTAVKRIGANLHKSILNSRASMAFKIEWREVYQGWADWLDHYENDTLGGSWEVGAYDVAHEYRGRFDDWSRRFAKEAKAGEAADAKGPAARQAFEDKAHRKVNGPKDRYAHKKPDEDSGGNGLLWAGAAAATLATIGAVVYFLRTRKPQRSEQGEA